jgi:hypothetical protein
MATLEPVSCSNFGKNYSVNAALNGAAAKTLISAASLTTVPTTAKTHAVAANNIFLTGILRCRFNT